MSRRFFDLVSLVGSFVGEFIAPTGCVSCDEKVAFRALFCPACMVSVGWEEKASDDDWSVFVYGGAVATAITRMKYGGRLDLAPRLGAMMASAVAGQSRALISRQVEALASVDVVVPVPMHPHRLVERGFDQAALLAHPIARQLQVAYAPLALMRTRATLPQASLDRENRIANVRAAFGCRQPHLVRGRHVLLVDDVRTTGATLRACAVVLNNSGATRVSTLVLANRDDDFDNLKIALS